MISRNQLFYLSSEKYVIFFFVNNYSISLKNISESIKQVKTPGKVFIINLSERSTWSLVMPP